MSPAAGEEGGREWYPLTPAQVIHTCRLQLDLSWLTAAPCSTAAALGALSVFEATGAPELQCPPQRYTAEWVAAPGAPRFCSAPHRKTPCQAQPEASRSESLHG